MTDEDIRAERAFRMALAEQAESLHPVPLTIYRRPTSHWRSLGAVAAVLVIIAGAGLLATRWDDGRAPVERDPAGEHLGDLPRPDEGWKWVSFMDVAVQVPQEWRHADLTSPYVDACPRPDDGPFVETPNWFFADVRCQPPGDPDGFLSPGPPWVANLDWTDLALVEEREQRFSKVQGRVTGKGHDAPAPADLGAPADGTFDYGDWQVVRRSVGGVQVSLLTDATTRPLAERIVGSARTFATDQAGCDAQSPVQVPHQRPDDAFEVLDVDEVDTISVCQYTRARADAPGLLGSRLLSGEDADALLEAIQDTAVGGGPERPTYCEHDGAGNAALTVRLRTGDDVRDLFVDYNWCVGNGYDDGVDRRELTTANCLPLWGGPVRVIGGMDSVFEVCAPGLL